MCFPRLRGVVASPNRPSENQRPRKVWLVDSMPHGRERPQMANSALDPCAFHPLKLGEHGADILRLACDWRKAKVFLCVRRFLIFDGPCFCLPPVKPNFSRPLIFQTACYADLALSSEVDYIVIRMSLSSCISPLSSSGLCACLLVRLSLFCCAVVVVFKIECCGMPAFNF